MSDEVKKEPTEKLLVDDLADVLSRMVVGWEAHGLPDLAKHPDVVRVMARYRATRAKTDTHDPARANTET